MIIDIPTSDEFNESASGLLNTAWSQVADLLIEFDDISSEIEVESTKTEFTEEGFKTETTFRENKDIEKSAEQYWNASKQTMLISLSLIQQAVEFFIKGRIVSISSHLIISGPVSSWPKKSDKENISFSSFKTIDAQELVKVHDTVYTGRFNDEFKQWYDEMRTLRNKIMHSIPKDITLKPENLLESILYVHCYFLDSISWPKSRFKFLENTPANSIHYLNDYLDSKPYTLEQVYRELSITVSRLEPSKIKYYLSFNKRERSMCCIECINVLGELDHFHESRDDYIQASQKVNGTEKSFKCFICETTKEITFLEDECECCEVALIDSESMKCLKCGCDKD